MEAEQTIAAKKKALEQVQHKVRPSGYGTGLAATVYRADTGHTVPSQHDINNATRSEKLHQLEAVGSNPQATTGATGVAPGTTGYGNEPVGTGVGGGPGYTTAAPAAR